MLFYLWGIETGLANTQNRLDNQDAILPMRNWNSISIMADISPVKDAILPMRNWNYSNPVFCGRANLGCYSTYEELKPSVLGSPYIFWPRCYSTYEELKLLHPWQPVLWRRRCYSTYEELKLNHHKIIIYSYYDAILPMRNWNLHRLHWQW